MIHFSCDCCKRELEPQDLRYTVKMEVFAAFDPTDMGETEDDRDNLQEIQDILQHAEDVSSDQLAGEVYKQMRYDLCPACHKRFMKNPLGREIPLQFQFSKN